MSDELKKLLKEAKKLGIKVNIFPSFSLIKLSFKGKTRYILRGIVPLNKRFAGEITKNKNLTKILLKRAGIKVPKGFLSFSLKEALRNIKDKKLNFPLVVKPNDKALGEKVFAKIESKKELKECISILIKEKYLPFLVEEYFEGEDFRFLLIKKKIIAVARRIPPFVIGDGRSSLKKLIEKFNKKRKKPLLMDEEVFRNLKKQKVSLETVVEKGKKIKLRENANQGTGGLVEDVTEKVHPFFKKIVKKIAKELDLDFVGIDILTKNITKKSPYVVIEVNSCPTWTLHEEVDFGKKRKIAKEIIKSIFS